MRLIYNAFIDVTYMLTNLTTDGFAKALTAMDGYSLPDTITVTMGGNILSEHTGYTYDKTTGKVKIYRVSAGVAITAVT